MGKSKKGKQKKDYKNYMASAQAIDMAIQCHMEGELEEARRIYKRILKHHPKNANVLNNLAILYKEMGNFDQAVKYFKKAIIASPEVAETYNNLGVVYKEQGKVDEAIACFQKAMDMDPDLNQARNNLAELLLKQQKQEEAMAIYKAKLSQDPDSAEAHNSLGVILEQQGHLEDAISEYKKAIGLNPKLAEAHNNLGTALKKQGKLSEAITHLEKALSINPHMAEIHNNLGSLYEEQGKMEKAINSYQKAIEKNPRFIDAYNNLGLVLQSLGHLDDAIACFRQALIINPKAAEVYNNLGTALEHQGNVEDAISCFEKAIELNPNLISAKHMLNALRGKTTDEAPKAYVRELFDKYSERFDVHITERLEYKVPDTLINMLLKACGNECRFSTGIDLGCGTGLLGEKLRYLVGYLIGIDISSKMIDVARGKKIYDELHVGEMVEYLGKSNNEYDLVVSADVFVYIGNLKPIFEAVSRSTMEGAIFCFSTEVSESEDYILLSTGRYAHSLSYIQKLAKDNSFELVMVESGKLRKERGVWIEGNYYTLRRIKA